MNMDRNGDKKLNSKALLCVIENILQEIDLAPKSDKEVKITIEGDSNFVRSQQRALKQLEKSGAIKVKEINKGFAFEKQEVNDRPEWLYGKTTNVTRFDIPSSAIIRVDLAKLRTKYTELKKLSRVEEERSSGPNGLEKDKNGNFRIGGKLIEMKSGTLYQCVLDILFSKQGQDGKTPFENVVRELRKRGFLKGDESEEQIRKKVSNAIRNGLFRFAKVNGSVLRNETPDGRKMIDTYKKQGGRFAGWALNI